MKPALLNALIAAGYLAVSSQMAHGADPPADLAVLNGRILTVDGRFSIVEAAAVRDGRFVAVGANARVKKLVGDRTRVIDARGKTVVPGLIESHVHAIDVARDEAVQPFVQLSSIAEIQQWVRQQAQSTPQGDWIQIPRIDLTRLRERAAQRLGWQMCSHVTGDAGVDLVLGALERVNRDEPVRDRRYTLIHAYFPNPASVRRAAELGVCVDTQPDWYYKDGDALAKALGEARLKNFIGLADWLNGGVKVAINSDHMHGIDPNKSLNPFNPFLAMYIAVTRRMESGKVIGPEQRVSRERALRMMTIDAAYLSFDEKRKGSIEVGKLGDLAVLSDDLLSCDAGRIKDIRALATVVGGKIVHDLR